MRVRPIISAGLAIVLVSLSSWSAACELCCRLPRCGAPRTAPITAGSAARATAMSHAHCGEAAKARRTMALASAALKSNSCCRRVPCGQATILTLPMREQGVAQFSQVQRVVAKFVSMVTPNPTVPTPEISAFSAWISAARSSRPQPQNLAIAFLPIGHLMPLVRSLHERTCMAVRDWRLNLPKLDEDEVLDETIGNWNSLPGAHLL